MILSFFRTTRKEKSSSSVVDSTELDTQGSREFRLQGLVIKPARKEGGLEGGGAAGPHDLAKHAAATGQDFRHPRPSPEWGYAPSCSARIGFANSGKSFWIVFQTSDKLIVI